MRILGSLLFTASTAIALGMLCDAGLGIEACFAGGDDRHGRRGGGD
jgi:hypothetical protein